MREEDGEGLEDEMLILCQGGGQRVGMGSGPLCTLQTPGGEIHCPLSPPSPGGAVEVGSILHECWRQGTGRSSNGMLEHDFRAQWSHEESPLLSLAS